MTDPAPSSQPTLNLKMNHAFSRFLKLCYEYRYPLIATFLFGFLSYMFVFTNKLLNHDELGNLFGLGFMASSGRWGLNVLSYILPVYSMPWFNGVLTLCFMAVAICLIIRIYSIQNRLLQVLLAGLIIVFPSLIGTFCYMFTSPSYGISFLCSVLCVYCIIKGTPLWTLAGITCCTFSLSIYQAYIAVTASMMVLYLIQKTLYTDTPCKTIFLQGVWFVVCLLISLGLYFGVSQVFLHFLGEEMNDYAQQAIPESRTIIDRIRDSLLYFIFVLTRGIRSIVPLGMPRTMHLFCGAVVGVELIFWCCRKQNWKRIPMLILLMIAFPFAVSSIPLVVAWSAIHSLVLYGFIAVYILAAIVIEGNCRLLSPKALINQVRTLLMDLSLAAMALVIASNIALANEAYLNTYINNSRNYSFATSTLAQIEMVPEYKDGMPVAFIGQYPAEAPEGFSNLNTFTGIQGFISSKYTYGDLYKYYCGTELNVVPQEEVGKYEETEAFARMPAYPNHGFIQVIDGCIVVKLPPEPVYPES